MRGHQAIESGFSRVFGAQPALPKGQLVTVECDIVKGLHAFTIVGLPDKAVEEAKDRLAAAIKNTGSEYESPKRSNKKIVFSLAPAELKKEGSAFDLPLALAFLLASEQIEFDPAGKLFAGELALDGSVRTIRGALSIALCARDEGFTDLFVPAENADEAALVPGIQVYPVRTLGDLLQHLDAEAGSVLAPHARTARAERRADDARMSLSDIRGQESAKRGLEIAAAGGHTIGAPLVAASVFESARLTASRFSISLYHRSTLGNSAMLMCPLVCALLTHGHVAMSAMEYSPAR